MNFDKQLKSGLKKCPLHKFGANYNLIKDGWYQCTRCKAFHKIDFDISDLGDDNKLVKIKQDKWGIGYKFL